MKIMHSLAGAVLGFSLINISHADSVAHFEGRSADSLTQAIGNFNTGNKRLEKMLSQDDLSANDLAAIHELTYTLENALDKINDELAQLALTLEEVHLGSEENDAERVQTEGANYLAVTKDLAALK